MVTKPEADRIIQRLLDDNIRATYRLGPGEDEDSRELAIISHQDPRLMLGALAGFGYFNHGPGAADPEFNVVMIGEEQEDANSYTSTVILHDRKLIDTTKP